MQNMTYALFSIIYALERALTCEVLDPSGARAAVLKTDGIAHLPPQLRVFLLRHSSGHRHRRLPHIEHSGVSAALRGVCGRRRPLAAPKEAEPGILRACVVLLLACRYAPHDVNKKPWQGGSPRAEAV